MKIIATSALVLMLGATAASASTGHRSQRLGDRQLAGATAITVLRGFASPFRLAGDPGYRSLATLTGGPSGGFIGAN